MKHHRGFVLFELLLYVLFLGFFAYAFSSMIYQLWHTILIHNKKREQLMVLHMAGDMFRHDIHEAPSRGALWKERAAQLLIWYTADGDIGWKQEEDRLVRIIGHYSCSKHQWICYTKNVIAQHIKKAQFQIEGNERITMVTLHMEAEYGACEIKVMPCTRK